MSAVPNIHEIKLEPINKDVVEQLEKALERAREGDVSMFAMVMIERNGCPSFWHSQMHNHSLMIGAVGRLEHRLCEMADD